MERTPPLGQERGEGDCHPRSHCRQTEKVGGEKEQKAVFGFRTVFVFDVSQTEGKELPEFAKLSGDPGELQTRLETVIAGHGINFSYVDSLDGANSVSLDVPGKSSVRDGSPAADCNFCGCPITIGDQVFEYSQNVFCSNHCCRKHCGW